MQIIFRCVGFELTSALHEHATTSVLHAVRPARGVERVVLRLEDVNGPKGGPDKRCTVHLHGSVQCSVEALDSDGYAAITLACAKLGRALQRALAKTTTRARRLRRSHPSPPLYMITEPWAG